VLPLALAAGVYAEKVLHQHQQAVSARFHRPGLGGGARRVLYDAMWEPRFVYTLLAAIVRRRRLRGQVGTLQSICTTTGAGAQGADVSTRMPISPPRDDSNTTVVCGGWGVLKLYRRMDVGTQPEFEIGHVMSTHGFAHTPVVLGALEHHQPQRGPLALALVQRFVPHTRDAWEYTLARLRRDLRRAQLSSPRVPAVSLTVAALLNGAGEEPPPLARQCFAPMLKLARRLGQRTAEMHLTLAAETEDPAFAPQPLTALDRRPLFERRLKRLVLHDVAGMLRSFHYDAPITCAVEAPRGEARRTKRAAPAVAWVRFWQYWVTRPSSHPTSRLPARVPCCPRRATNCMPC
jgi:maltose alpha-D-glucosyltransferase / alpha-amylase